MTKRGAGELILSPGVEESNLKKMDLKSSPVKDESREAEAARIQAEIQESAPSWFANAFSFILKEFETLKTENQSIQSLRTELTANIGLMEEKIVKLEESNSHQSDVIKALEDKITSLEAYTRRDNLLFEGIPESPNEDLHSKVSTFINHTLKVP